MNAADKLGVRDPMAGVVYPNPERLRRYVDAGELPQTTLVEALGAAFERHADRVALASSEGELRYRELDEITDRLGAALLALGLQPLDRVLFQAANSRDLIVTFVGCLKAGLIPVCTLPNHREREIEGIGRHTGARAHIVQGDDPKFDLVEFARKVRPRIASLAHVISLRSAAAADAVRYEDLVAAQDPIRAKARLRDVPRDPFQVAVFQLSGGTTGIPKVIPRMQNDYLLNAQYSIRAMAFTANDVLFMPMPMIHNAAMICFWLPALLAGATFAIPADMSPEAWGEVFTAYQPTFIGLIRPLLPRFDAMLEAKLGTLGRVRGAWAPDAARMVREKYGIPSQAMFGMTEGMNMYTYPDDPLHAQDWTVGRPLSPHDEVKLVAPGTEREVAPGEPGELLCRGAYTLHGYFNLPEHNARVFTADGFYRTGDILIRRQIDGRDYYAFAGRTKDVVNRGHEKIDAEEIENAVSTHAAVASCAVVGVPDEWLGERVCACLVVRAGVRAPDVAELGRHLEGLGFAKFKWPERIAVLAELPVTKVGKLDKAALRARVASGDAQLQLRGVHHTARPTWKLAETVAFYRDVLGLPLVHAVSARGWGAAHHPDFLHFFFDSGNGSTIAFFYYLGHDQPAHLMHRPEFDNDAIHTAWQVHTREELLAWRRRLEAGGVSILYQIEHEVIESIYFRDPNGYYLEITRPLRSLTALDASDADLTVRAAIAEEAKSRAAGQRLTKIEPVWHAKGELVARLVKESS